MKKKKYFGAEEEQAVKDYIHCEGIDERNKLFTAVIRPAFNELIENIFFTYNFNTTLGSLEDIRDELMIHLFERIDKFDVTRGTKAFSFFGTVTKNWLIQKSNQAKKRVSIDEEEKVDLIKTLSINEYTKDVKNEEDAEFINFLRNSLSSAYENKTNLNEDDKSVLSIVVNLLENYNMFNIYNKKQVYVYIREGTGLQSKKITRTLQKVRMLYQASKKEFYETRDA
tara:strand:+ start:1651 stop:2328 length:678 start_codon:yes stop_codon:yes gene_type:complete